MDRPRLYRSPHMSREDLAAAIERSAAGMNHSTLVKVTGLASRTLRELMDPRSTRRFGRVTLNKLDAPLGWASGTAWRLYNQTTVPLVPPQDQVSVELDALRQRLALLEERPSWADEWLEVGRHLSPEERASLLAVARLYARSR